MSTSSHAVDFSVRHTANFTLSLRRLNHVLLLAAPLLLAVVALLLGKKTGWDHYNYHWYNPYALLNGRLGFDVAVGHHATYYHPLIDVPLYLIAKAAPAWVGGVFMGVLNGLVVALVGVIAHRSLPGTPSRTRTAFVAVLALLSVTGAGAFQEIGDPANDITVALGAFAGVAMLLNWLAKPVNKRRSAAVRIPLLAGLCAGTAVAIKLTTAPYALALAAAILVTDGAFKQRLLSAFACSAGVALGLLAVGGPWMYQLWSYSGNPLFPYFNDLIRSPLLLDQSYRDLNFRPEGWRDALTFPWQFTLDSRQASESTFRDPRILIVYVLLPVATLWGLWRRRRHGVRMPEPTRLLFAFWLIAYAAWVAVFGIYRYAIPLEMLSPLLIALIASMLVGERRLYMFVTAAVLVVAQSLVRIDVSDRQTWRGPYVDVQVPALSEPDRTMVVMTGYAPMAYVIPDFPSTVPFLRIDGWLIGGDDRRSGLALAMRDRVAKHDGPILVLFQDHEVDMTHRALANYEMTMLLNGQSCDRVRTNIGPPMWLCKTARIEG